MTATLGLTPSSWNAGDVRVSGGSATQDFTLANTGDTPAALGTLAITGSGTFVISNDLCSDATLGPGESCTFTVTFTPTSNAPFSGTLTAPTGFYETALSTDPVSYVRLDEAAGSFADQLAVITGTLSGGATRGVTGALSPADTNAAVDLNGTTGVISFGDFYDFDGMAAFSAGLWFMLDGSTTAPRLLSKENFSNNGWRLIWNDATGAVDFTRFSTDGGTDTASSSTTAGVDATWHFAVATFDGTDLTAYLDATAGTTVSSSNFLPGNGSNLCLGRNASSAANFLNGKADELLVWDRMLSSQEVTTLYDAQLLTDVTAALSGNGVPNLNDTPAYTTVEPTHQQVGVDSPGLGHGHNDFVTYGVYNGNFALGPPDPSANLDVASSTSGSNFMPDWRFIQSSNTNITAKQVRDTASPSGSNLRFTYVSGAADDAAFVEQIIDIGGSRTRLTGDYLRVFAFAGAANTGTFVAFIRLQYLTVDGSIVGLPAEVSQSIGPAAGTGATFVLDPVGLFGASPPATAARLRVRLGTSRSGAANSATGTIDFTDIRRDRAVAYSLLADLNAPQTYLPGQVRQFDGVLLLDPGGGIVQLQDGVLRFPGTQIPSAGANDLDDYEEGTWTPDFTFATPGTLSVAYTQRNGQYTKIGNRVYFSCYFLLSSYTLGTGTGNMRITGLPFTVSATTSAFGGAAAAIRFTAAGYTNLMALPQPSQTYLQIYASGSGVANAYLNQANFPSGTTFDCAIAGHYHI